MGELQALCFYQYENRMSQRNSILCRNLPLLSDWCLGETKLLEENLSWARSSSQKTPLTPQVLSLMTESSEPASSGCMAKMSPAKRMFN